MKIGRLFRKPLALTGALSLGYLGSKAFFNTLPGADGKFQDWTGPTHTIEGPNGRVTFPIRKYRSDVFVGIFSAALEPVRAALPSPELYPVRLAENRTQIVIAAFNYLDTDIGPYGEIMIGTYCTFEHEAVPVLPMLLEGRYPRSAFFVFHLPVTNAQSRDSGRELHGYPAFVADMAFERRPAYQSVRLSEGDEHILTLTVKQRGLLVTDGRTIRTFSVLNGDVRQTDLPTRAIYQLNILPRGGSLSLGEHAIARQLSEFEIGSSPLITRAYLQHAAILPHESKAVGTATRRYPGHTGRDILAGRYTLRHHDKQPPVNLHHWQEIESS